MRVSFPWWRSPQRAAIRAAKREYKLRYKGLIPVLYYNIIIFTFLALVLFSAGKSIFWDHCVPSYWTCG